MPVSGPKAGSCPPRVSCKNSYTSPVFDSRIDNLKPYRDSYYFIARNDVSAFHQFLANAALHRTLYTSGGKILTSHDATAQHHKALQLAQIRVGDIKDRVSDGMIATVLMMAAYNVSNLSHLQA